VIKISKTKDHKIIAELNEGVQNLHAELHPDMFKPFNQTEMEKALEEFLSDPDCHCYVAKQNGMAIGYALFMIREAKENAFHYTIRSLYIDQIAVLPKYQKTGAGKLLMKQAEQLARENNISKIELDHWSANQVAAKFFRNNGYKLYKERLFKMID
jgi:ribosomal protein S18 acetylase RimI-like enzyme